MIIRLMKEENKKIAALLAGNVAHYSIELFLFTFVLSIIMSSPVVLAAGVCVSAIGVGFAIFMYRKIFKKEAPETEKEDISVQKPIEKPIEPDSEVLHETKGNRLLD